MQTKKLYPYALLAVSSVIVGVSLYFSRFASESEVMVPIFFDTPYHTFRTLLALVLFSFFGVLMGRHIVLLLFSVMDQIDRALDDARRRRSTKPPYQPLITIITPAYNEGVCIEASIRSLLCQDYPRYEVLVIDDGSTDDTLQRARKLEGDHGNARVQVLWKPNGGKATALNFGIQRAAGEFVATMDSDSTLSKDALKEAIRHFEDPDVGAVAGAVHVVNPNTLWSCLQFLEYTKGLNLVRRAQGFLRGVSIVPGPIGVFRKSALTRVGLYDQSTFAEDCDVTLRLLLDGWKICYEPRAIARTEAPERLVPLIKQRYRWTRGILQAIRKNRRGLIVPKGGLLSTLMLWYMVFEALVWPLMTGFTVTFMLLAGFDSAVRPAATYFWFMLLLLDTATTLYCLSLEELSLWYLLLAPVERMVFSLVLDVCRILASIEEFVGLQMSWGKLDRMGRT